MLTLYGIRNCDTVKKARKWLEAHNVEYRFHDYRQQGLEEETLRGWVADLGWEVLLNRRGTSWRKVAEPLKSGIDRENAIRLMLTTPALIRRPVLDTGEVRIVGFKEADYERVFASRHPC